MQGLDLDALVPPGMFRCEAHVYMLRPQTSTMQGKELKGRLSSKKIDNVAGRILLSYEDNGPQTTHECPDSDAALG